MFKIEASFKLVAIASLTFVLLTPTPIFCQAAQSLTSEQAKALKNAEAGSADARNIVVISSLGLTQAMPSLEQEFTKTTNVTLKASIASGLVKLRDPDPQYWTYLASQVTTALNLDIPDPAFSKSQNAMVGESPELKEWAGSHGMRLKEAFVLAQYTIPGRVILLGDTVDTRAIPLLQQALKSRNYLAEVYAAKGLAALQDAKSITLISQASQRAPDSYGPLIAESLLYFNNDEAKQAATTILSSEQISRALTAKANNKEVY